MRAHTSAQRRRIALVAILTLLTTVPVAPRTEQPIETVTLAWDASRGDTSGYRVHVGTQSRFYSQWYDVGRATTFVFADVVPGTRYFFAVTAYDAEQRESPFSNEVSFLIGEEPAPPVTAQSAGQPRAREGQALAAGADALGPVTGIAALPDGRVLFVESATRVRMMSSAGLVSAAALSAESRGVEFTELVVDPAFARSGFVFVGTTELQRDGRREFRVRRYRLVGEALGEGATIIGNLLFRDVHAPRFTVDDLGRFYVAMPGASGARTDPYAGRVLRFAADGSVPNDQRGLSPIVADGLPVPLDLDWDGRAVWVVGLDDRSQSTARRLRLDVDDDGWPRRLSGTGLESWPGLDVSAVEVTASGNDLMSPAFVVDTAHRLYRVTRRADDAVAQVEPMPWPADTLPVDVAIGPQGSMHVVVKTANDAFAIVAVTHPH
jgi:hypothetical protein